MKIRIFALLFNMAIFTNCHIGVDTVDPQASYSIEDSKKNGFFLQEYSASQVPGNYFHVKQAWLEYSWKYSINNGKVEKKKLDEIQLVLRLDHFANDSIIQDKNYLIDWGMKEEASGYLAKSKVYILFIKNKESKDTFNIDINRIKNNVDTEHLGGFLTVKK